MEHVYHENRYRDDETLFVEQLNKYNVVVQEYYLKRTNGTRKDTWTEQVANTFEKRSRMYMDKFVKSQGLDKR